MKPTQEQVIAWAREAEIGWLERAEGVSKFLERFAALAYEAGRKDENEGLVQVLRRIKLEKGFVCDCGVEDATWDLIEAIQEKTDGSH